MAWTELYMQTTGSNLNAGSTTADAASVTSTNGDWDNAAAGRFTAASGTPFTGVSVGQYASIYLDAATSAVFVSKITAVDAGGTYIEVSKTANKLGAAPTAGATGRSCKIGGAWANDAIVSLFGVQTVDQSWRINVKAGAYAANTTVRNFAAAGITTALLWWRGYNTTPGDLDDYSSLTKPVWTATGSGRWTFSAAFTIITGMDFTAAVAGFTLTLSGANIMFHRNRVTNTNANVASIALSATGAGVRISCNYFETTSSANVVSIASTALSAFVVGNVFTGGIHGVAAGLTNGTFIGLYNVCRNLAGEGFNFSAITGGNIVLAGNTIYSCGSHAIEFATVPTALVAIYNNAIWSITGFGINSSAGTTGCVSRGGNVFRACSSGDENGLGDSPGAAASSGATFGSLDDSVDGWTSATNMTPVAASLARAKALPRTFEYESYSTYADNGAVQHQDAGGGGAPVFGGHVARRA